MMTEPTAEQNAAAYGEIMALVREHNLAFWNNPGGGEFSKPGGGFWRCQIANYGDHVDDLAKLRKALSE